jgi:hypothetical protein
MTRQALRVVTGTARCWGPLVAGFVCLVAVSFVGAIVGWLLLIVAGAAILDGFTAMLQRAGRTGNLRSHRQ